MQQRPLAPGIAICNKLLMAKPKTLTSRLHSEVGLSQPYASQVATGAREPSLKTALLIYEKTGVAFGDLKGKSKRQIETITSAHKIMSGA